MIPSDKYTEIRKANVRILLKERFGDRQVSLAEELGVSQQAVSTWVSESEKSRPMGERAARNMEEKLGLKRYSLDSETFAKDHGFTAQQTEVPSNLLSTILVPGDVVQLKNNSMVVCTDSGSRIFMAVDLSEHTIASILSTDDLTNIEERFYYHEHRQLKKVGFIELNLSQAENDIGTAL